MPRVTKRGGDRADPGSRSPKSQCRTVRSSGRHYASSLDRPRQRVSTGWQLPHLSFQAVRKDFPKDMTSPPLSCAKNLSFHGDSQIANPSKSEPGGEKKKKLAYPQRSVHGWHWGCPLLRMKAEQTWAVLLGPDGKISGMPGPQASGPWAQATGGGGSSSSLPHGKAQVNPFGDTTFLGRLLGTVFPWCFPIFNLKN